MSTTGQRTDLHELLCGALGSRNAYFQPPESVKMRYPAIVYSLADVDTDHANDRPYLRRKAYTVTVIDKDPDSEVAEAVSLLPCCRFDRHYASDNLHHFAFRLTY